MESPDLNSPSASADEFDRALHRQAALSPIADDGFSARVVAALPARPRTFNFIRATCCGLGAVIGAALALAQIAAAGITWETAFAFDVTLLDGAHQQLVSPALLVAAAATGATLLFVFWPRWRAVLR